MTDNRLPIAYVGDKDGPLARFYGEHAVSRAEAFISTLPNAEYDLDVSDDECHACGATFSSEAWEQTGRGWACPHCGAAPTTDQLES